MKDIEAIKAKLHRYIDNTSLIRELSSPKISEVNNSEEYRKLLIKNFVKIGELSKENSAILEAYYFPLMESAKELDREDIEIIRSFSKALLNAYKLDYLDIPMVYQQALLLLDKVESSDSETDRILALDNVMPVAYAMICTTNRMYPVNDVSCSYQKVGLEAAERLLKYLDHDKFKTLDDTSKELVLINARYIRVVSEIDGVPCSKEQNELNLQRMKDALALAEDPFYLEQLPSYNWDYHIFRTLEYISSFTDQNNMRGFDEESVQFINACAKRLVQMFDSNPEYYESIDNAKIIELYACRNAYLAHELTLDEYKDKLKDIYRVHSKEKHTNDSLVVLYAPVEYILVIDKDNLKKEDIDFLNDFYDHAIDFMHKTPKKNSLVFLLFFITVILKNFIEIPGGLDFETMCLSMIAAIHPPTYVHTLSVADLSLCIAQHVFKRNPELFEGMPFFDKNRDIKEQASALQHYVYHAALCHDFGKLMIAETILTYGRNLLDSEFSLVRSHPSAGAYLLKGIKSTEKYADIAIGHHKWYNDQGGYPKDFMLENSPYRTVIEIVTCADCLDAATDTVGRSYKDGISLDEYFEELKEESGTRYAPYLYDLLIDPDIRKQIEELITKGREDNYHKVFDILKTHESK